MIDGKTYEIFVDASFEKRTKIASYAIVIIQEKKTVKAFAKKCSIQLDSSTECEIFAIFQAINIIEANLMNDKSNNFTINTDCLPAKEFLIKHENDINVFKDNIELYNKIKETYNRIYKKMTQNRCNFKIKWISREKNKIAHKYSYSAFKSLKVQKYKNYKVLLKKEKLLNFFKEFNSKQCKVLIYLGLIANENKIISRTQDEISKALRIPTTSINKIFKELINMYVLKKIKNGKYKLEIL